MNDYKGKTWFWHRFVWRLPAFVLSVLEFFYIVFASFFYSPRNALNIVRSKFKTYIASIKKNNTSPFYNIRVGSCFSDQDVKDLARLIRTYYSSCLWKKGDILLVDNKKVMHAGMPGTGPRLIRAMIGNPLQMKYSFLVPGTVDCQERTSESIGFYMAKATPKTEENCNHHPPS